MDVVPIPITRNMDTYEFTADCIQDHEPCPVSQITQRVRRLTDVMCRVVVIRNREYMPRGWKQNLWMIWFTKHRTT